VLATLLAPTGNAWGARGRGGSRQPLPSAVYRRRAARSGRSGL